MTASEWAALTSGHAARLRWFQDNAGTVTRLPKAIGHGLLLVTRPKGIYKPAGIPYAVSVRINLDSPYNDGVFLSREEGTWYFTYHQENPDPTQRDTEYANRGLMACVRDRVPVGVLRERQVARRSPPEYDVLGLGLPVTWEDGYFLIEAYDTRALAQSADVTFDDALRATAQALQQAGPPPAPTDDYDARVRAYRSIVARQGQPGFRRDLLQLYGGRCAVTGCQAVDVLEAAHLRPYRGPDSNTPTNGLLLRSDLHTLLDLALIAFRPVDRTVVLSSAVATTEYVELADR